MKERAAQRTFDSLRVGEEATVTRFISEEDVSAFAKLSGDFNPLHTDEEYAKTTPHKSRIVHGMFLGALVSQLVGMYLPGKNALLVREALEFKKPVRIGETVVIKGIVANKSAAVKLVEISITVTSANVIVASGSAQALVLE